MTLTLAFLSSLFVLILTCATFQALVHVLEYRTNQPITPRNEKMIRRLAICLVIIFVLSCTVVYLKDSSKNNIDIDEQQGLMPLDAELKVDTQMNDTKTQKPTTEKE